MTRTIALALFAISLQAQDRLPRELQGTHVFATVPMVGAGTADDPKRPMFTPSPSDLRNAALRTDGLSPFPVMVQYQIADDGKTALVEFMSQDRKVLQPILSSNASNIQIFERGVAKQVDIQAAFLKAKQAFTLHSMTPAHALDITALKAQGVKAQ